MFYDDYRDINAFFYVSNKTNQCPPYIGSALSRGGGGAAVNIPIMIRGPNVEVINFRLTIRGPGWGLTG